MVASALVGGVVSSVIGGGSESQAASSASDAQSLAAEKQIAETRRQFDEIRKLLSPYVDAGGNALHQQMGLSGLYGEPFKQELINNIANGSQMNELTKQGENAILQNASATGGLRGGNTQAALAQFRPQLLNQLIDQQYGRLNGLSAMGQNSAAGVGAAGQNATNSINNAYQQQGAAQAGGALAQGRANSNMFNGISQAAGMAFGGGNSGMGGFGDLFGGGIGSLFSGLF